MISARLTAFALLWLIAAFPAVAAAQARLTGADLQGVITDPSGAVLPGVTLTATNVDTSLERTAVSADDGRYLIPALPPGSYRVTAALTGFETATKDDLVLHIGELVDVSVQLPLARVQEAVTVAATVPIVNPFRTTVSFVVDSRQITDLPINGRRFVSFAALSPGVVPAGSTEAGADTTGLSFLGGRPVSNNLMVDGLDNNDRILGGANASFSQEAVREFQVITTSYPAEFGSASGGILNIVTKSGTNAVHGGAFLFYRDDALNARNHFEQFDPYGTATDREKAPFDQTQGGGTLGLPIRRGRTFLFAAAERTSIDASNFVTIDPVAAATLTAGGFPVEVGDVPYRFRLTEASARVDHHWTPSRVLTVRAFGSDLTNENYEPFGGLVARSHGAAQFRNDWGVSGSETDVLGGRWVVETRAQYSRQAQQTQALDPTCGGPCVNASLGGPSVTLLGTATVGQSQNEPTDRVNRQLQIKSTVTRATSLHTMKAGLDYTVIDHQALLSYSFGGDYVFSALPAIPGVLPVAISALQAFQAGVPVYYTQGYGNGTTPYGYREMAAFVQDDWRVAARVTVKAGARYQQQVFPDRDVTVTSLNGTTLTYPFPLGGAQVSPRLAVAYDPAGDGRTAVHAAYGLFFGNQLTTMYGVTDLFTRADGTRLHLFPFPSSAVGWQLPGHRLPDTNAPLPRVTITIGPDAATPRVHQTSLGVSRALTPRVAVSADVVYARGSHQLGALEYNPLVPALGPGRRPNDVNGIAGTSTNVAQFTDFGSTWYRGLMLTLRGNISAGRGYGVAYTWADAKDDSSIFTGLVDNPGRGRNPENPTGLPLGFDPVSEKGPVATSQRHRLVAEGVWTISGLQLASVITVNSGLPFTPLAGTDLNGDGLPQADRARTNPFDPTTAVGRNSVRMPSQATVDLRASKALRLGSRSSLVPMIEVFNLFNRTNYSEINTVFGPGAYPSQPARDDQGRVTYGTFQKALAPRQVQLAVRLIF
jgi:Carboxypeptidase regulatory-like domain